MNDRNQFFSLNIFSLSTETFSLCVNDLQEKTHLISREANMYIMTSYEGLFEFDETNGKFRILLNVGCFGICKYLDRFFITVSTGQPLAGFHPHLANTNANTTTNTRIDAIKDSSTMYTQFGSVWSFKYGSQGLTDIRIDVPTGLDQSAHGLTFSNNTMYVIETCLQRIRAYDVTEDGRVILNADLFDLHVTHMSEHTLSVVNLIDFERGSSAGKRESDSPRVYTLFGNKALSPGRRFLDAQNIYTESYRHINAINCLGNGDLIILNSCLSDWDENKNLKLNPHISVLTPNKSQGKIEHVRDTPIPGAKRTRESDIYHDLVPDPNQPDVFLTVCNDSTIVRVSCQKDVDASFVLEPIPISDTQISALEINTIPRVRGLAYDGKTYIVASKDTIQVIDEETHQVKIFKSYCIPCAIIKTTF